MIKDTTQPTLPFNYTAIVFDMDGVIFDSEVAVMNCWLELADKYGIKVIVDVVPNHTTKSTEALGEGLLNAVGGIDNLYHKKGSYPI